MTGVLVNALFWSASVVLAMSAASVPVVVVVGCAEEGSQPHIWKLARAGDRADTSRAGITAAERRDLAARPLGRGAYDLIGVADFVDAAASRRIGRRGDLLPAGRVNATAALVSGHKVAVKGLYIEGTPPRINLTSVVDLGGGCQSTAVQATAAPRTVWDGVFTEAQATRGADVYRRECSTCHGERLKGGEGAPALTGSEFMANWNRQSVGDLLDRIRRTMPAPPEQPGKLTPQQNADVVAHILSGNGFPAGAAALPIDLDALKQIRIDAMKP